MESVRGQSDLAQPGATRPTLASRGFTLVEVIVTVLVTLLLTGLLVAGIRVAATTARDQASQVTVRSIGVGVSQFEQQFGFLPPLVDDGAALNGPGPRTASGTPFVEFPVDRSGTTPAITAYSGRRGDVYLRGYHPDLGTRYQFITLNSSPAIGTAPGADSRYSKTSLPFYLIGALGADVDGVDGPGYNKPRASGTFELVGTGGAFEPFFNAGQGDSATLLSEYFSATEDDESGRAGGLNPTSVTRDDYAIVDRNGNAYRYYRWESGNPFAGRGEPEIASVIDQNIPSVLLDVDEAYQAELDFDAGNPISVDPTNGRTELRSARWAIVGAGADGLFGTEDQTTLIEAFGAKSDANILELRQRAREDNIVEVGG
ncbi:MAG: hypothetical protein AAGI53_10195 [Planctomycetota bacterium]